MGNNPGWAAPMLMALAISAYGLPNAQADDSKPVPAATSTAPASVKVQRVDTLDSRRASRDRDTGRLRAPTPDENAELDAARARNRGSESNVVVLRRPIGSVEVRADGSAVAKRSLDDLDNLVAERAAGGKLRVTHGNAAPVEK